MTGPVLQVDFQFVLAGDMPVQSLRGDVERLLGFSTEDFLSARIHLRERFHPDDAAVADLLFSPLFAGTSRPLNLRLRAADGKIRCLKALSRKSAPASGPVVLDLALKDPHTVIEPGDETLRANFKILTANTRDQIYVKNRNHVFLAAGPALASLVEGARGIEDVIGKTDYDLFPEEVADISYALERAAFAEGRITSQVQEVSANDGTHHWFDNRKYPLSNAEGEIIGVFGLAPEISDKIEANILLRESEASLRDAQEIARVGSFQLQLATKTWTASPPLQRILGIEPEPQEHPLSEFFPLIHPEDRPVVAGRLQGLFAGEAEIYDREYRIVRKSDGAVRWVHTRGRIERDAKGTPRVLHGTVQDITETKQAEAALRESRELLQLFIQHAPAALAMLDRNMCYVAASRRWIEMFDLSGKQIVGRSHYELFPQLGENLKAVHRRALGGEAIPPTEGLISLGDGRKRWTRHEVRPWLTADGQVGGIVIFTEDISVRVEAEERRRLAETVFTHTSEAILITDSQRIILEVNDAFTRITGYERADVVGTLADLIRSGLQTAAFYENIERSLSETGHWAGEMWNRKKNGELYVAQFEITVANDAEGKAAQFVVLFSDVTRVKEQERKLTQIAHYDALTGLPNRRLLSDRLRQSMAYAHRRGLYLAVAYLDLDDFKAVNDQHGEKTGDALLSALATRMRATLRDGDTLARLGGDEFAAVLTDLSSKEDAFAAVKRLLKAASTPVEVGDVVLSVSAGIGVALFPEPEAADPDQLLRHASQAMYQAKLAGRNSFHLFDPTEDLTVRGRYENREQMRNALSRGEFVLHYQPKVNMRSGEVVGAEALIRWQHPQRGLLPPGLFLPAIEGDPFSIDLGEWVIDTALAQVEEWQRQGLEMPVAVNVGALQLADSEFVPRLRVLLEAHAKIKPGTLELEVLETSAIQDVAQTSSVFEACRAMGVSFSIDDFGTGYSSLTYLQRLPAGALKLDQSFVRDMLEEPENLVILEGVLGLAAAFRRQVVAEGVETVEHGIMLLQLGCELAQGYGIARPMPAADLPAWAASWQPDAQWRSIPAVHSGNRALLAACAQHRALLGALDSYLRGKRPAAPPVDLKTCPFELYLESERSTGRSSRARLGKIVKLHEEFHALAEELLAAAGGGGNGKRRPSLEELEAKTRALIDSILSGSSKRGKRKKTGADGQT